MPINNPEAFCASLWNWSVLDGCFGNGTNIRPTDVDGDVERNGLFLTLETKLPHVDDIPFGQLQSILYKAYSGFHTVFLIWGRPGVPERLKIYKRHINGSGVPCVKIINVDPCNLELLRKLTSDWFKYAETRSKPTFETVELEYFIEKQGAK